MKNTKLKRVKLAKGVVQVPIQIYGGALLICSSRKLFEAQYKSMTGVVPNLSVGGDGAQVMLKNVEYKPNPCYLIGIFKRNHPVITHECAHAAIDIVKYAGVKPLKDSEAFTYLLDWIVGTVNTVLKIENNC